jgi:hypothetical protein
MEQLCSCFVYRPDFRAGYMRDESLIHTGGEERVEPGRRILRESAEHIHTIALELPVDIVIRGDPYPLGLEFKALDVAIFPDPRMGGLFAALGPLHTFIAERERSVAALMEVLVTRFELELGGRGQCRDAD